MSEELRRACFELARITKWDLKPVDTDAIQALGDSFYKTAISQESASLNIDTDSGASQTAPIPPAVIVSQGRKSWSIRVSQAVGATADEDHTIR